MWFFVEPRELFGTMETMFSFKWVLHFGLKVRADLFRCVFCVKFCDVVVQFKSFENSKRNLWTIIGCWEK